MVTLRPGWKDGDVHRCTCNDVTRPVGGTRGGQGERRAARGGVEGRVRGHQVVTGTRHRAVRETRAFFNTARAQQHQEHRGFERHPEQAHTQQSQMLVSHSSDTLRKKAHD